MQVSKSFPSLMAVIVTVLVSAPSLLGQTVHQVSNTQNYPWRVGASGQAGHTEGSSTAIPQPPKLGLRAATQDAADASAAPTPDDFQLDQVPTAPSTGDVYQSIVPEPALDVQSNATAEPNYCFRSKPQWCDLSCPKRLFNRPIAGFEIGGFSQFGYHNRDILPFNNRRGTFNPHQNWIYFDNNNAQIGGLAARYRFDAVYGVDAPELQAVGNSPTGAPDGWDNDFDYGAFGWAIPQAFVELTAGEWQVKIGKFLSPIGYEAAPATENFFYSRTYSRAFTEPFSHSGVLAQRNLNETTSQIIGVTAGWDSAFESNNGGFNLITGMAFQASPWARLSTTSSLGDTGIRGSGTLWSGVAEIQLAPKVQYVGQVDFLNLQTSDEFSVINSMYYCHNRCFALGARLEWWKSNQFQAEMASTYDFTVGANYRPTANILFRPEVRWDWGQNALDNGEVIFGFDTIFTF